MDIDSKPNATPNSAPSSSIPSVSVQMSNQITSSNELVGSRPIDLKQEAIISNDGSIATHNNGPNVSLKQEATVVEASDDSIMSECKSGNLSLKQESLLSNKLVGTNGLTLQDNKPVSQFDNLQSDSFTIPATMSNLTHDCTVSSKSTCSKSNKKKEREEAELSISFKIAKAQRN